jgi:plasmid maintenance system antidote protein VapI
MTYHPTPPPAPRAIPPEDVPRIDAMHKLGITQRAIARQIDVHWRTVHNIIARKGAYAGVPK